MGGRVGRGPGRCDFKRGMGFVWSLKGWATRTARDPSPKIGDGLGG